MTKISDDQLGYFREGKTLALFAPTADKVRVAEVTVELDPGHSGHDHMFDIVLQHVQDMLVAQPCYATVPALRWAILREARRYGRYGRARVTIEALDDYCATEPTLSGPADLSDAITDKVYRAWLAIPSGVQTRINTAWIDWHWPSSLAGASAA